MSMSDDSADVIAEQKLDPFIMDVREYLLKNKTPGGSPGYKAKVLCVAQMAFFDMGLAQCSPLAGHSGKQRELTKWNLVSGGLD